MTERALFLAALDMAPAQRSTYLDAACGSDRPLRQRLDRLLHAHEKARGFLEQPAHDLDATAGSGRANGAISSAPAPGSALTRWSSRSARAAWG